MTRRNYARNDPPSQELCKNGNVQSMKRSRLALGVLAAALIGTAAFFSRSSATALPAFALDSIASPAGPGSAEPNLAVGPDGKIHMTWLQPGDSGHALRMATLTGKKWSEPVTIRQGRDFFVNWADFPSIEVVDRNRLAVHWLQRTGNGTYAYAVRIAVSADGGRTWGEPVTPHRDDSPQEHGFVAMWPDAKGLGAVWLDGRRAGRTQTGAGEMMLLTTTIGLDGALGPETHIDERTCDCCQNTVAMTSSGPIVAYRNRTADEIRDVYVSRRVSGEWTTGVPVFNDNWKINACPVNGPALAASDKRVALAWFTGANDTAKVKVAFSNDAGAKFGSPIRIDAGSPVGRVDVVMLRDGGALVSWIERVSGEVAAVLVRRVGADGRTGEPITIATSSTARASGVPRMLLAGSDVIFAWTVPGRPSTVRVARASASSLR